MSNSIQITINRADIGFLLEAIELRSTAMIESIMGQVLDAMKPETQKSPDTNWTVSATDDGGLVATKNEAPAKSKKAPWGYKKDGTPKKRPGRHPMGTK